MKSANSDSDKNYMSKSNSIFCSSSIPNRRCKKQGTPLQDVQFERTLIHAQHDVKL